MTESEGLDSKAHKCAADARFCHEGRVTGWLLVFLNGLHRSRCVDPLVRPPGSGATGSKVESWKS
jgi:hypothetical protein